MSTEQTTSGVDELIRRVRDEGVGQAQEASDEILREARREAARIVADATAEADEAREAARIEIAADRESAHEALRMAARDTVLDLTARIGRAFEEHVKRLVASATADEEMLRTLVLLFAGKAAQEITQDKELEIMLSRRLFEGVEDDERLRERGRNQILALSREMLREGVELIPASDVQCGAKVRLVGENLEIDLTDEAISELLLRFMQPRFVSILRGLE
jgi:V/A-type H+-transporting ATPase subunit E